MIKINPGKSKTIKFTKVWVKNPLGYLLVTKKFRKGEVVNNWE
jgi:hypothetical protein